MSKRNVKKAAKTAKKHPVLLIALLVLVIVIIVAAVIIYFVKPDLYHRAIGLGDHAWSEWSTQTEAACDKDGLRQRTCTVCGDKEEEVIPATGNHTWSGWNTLTQATCAKNGYRVRSCDVCELDEEEVIPATGNHSYGDGEICKVCGFDKNFFGAENDVQEAEFSIHIIDLGKYAGDSIYIKAGENDILIDAGSRADSATLICEYLNNYVTDGKLEYVIATHADQDHIAAFAGNNKSKNGVLYSFEVDTLIHFDYVKKDKEANATKPTTVYGGFVEAVEYLRSNGTNVYTASQCYDEVGGAQRQYWLDSEHTLSMNILYNYYYYNQSSDENNHSVVTLFTKTKDTGNFNYLFTGDLEKDGESKMVDYYESVPADKQTAYNVLPEVDFYKAGHHGSGTSSTAKLLNVIKPKYIAVSCCAGAPEYTDNNLNTFPYQASLDNMLKHTDKIYCTGLAINLPELQNNKFAKKEWDYEPLNGNIVFFFNTRINSEGQTTGNIKLWCGSGNYETLPETEWFNKYRSWNNG